MCERGCECDRVRMSVSMWVCVTEVAAPPLEEMRVGTPTWKGRSKSFRTQARAVVERQTVTCAGEEVEKLEPSYGAGGM